MFCQLNSYFTEPTGQKYIFYLLCLAYVIGTSLVILIEPLLSLPCNDDNNKSSELEFENVLFEYSICNDTRHPQLLYLTRMECERGRHLLAAVFFGSLIGYERRTSDRPAGIRTMALVSLGSALFTINSTFGFLSGPMSWDASRVSAAIPSGVGFLGAGLIVKSNDVDPETGVRHHLIQGITTAAATWLSAAVGMACGGGLYFIASFSTAVNLLLLRFGPRAIVTHDESSVGSLPGGTGEFTSLLNKDVETGDGRTLSSYGVPEPIAEKLREVPAIVKRSNSLRNRPSLL